MKSTLVPGSRRSTGHVVASVAVATVACVAAAFAGGCGSEDEGTVVATSYPVDADYATSVAVTNAAYADDWGAVPFSNAGAIGYRDGGIVITDGGRVTDAGPILVGKDAGTSAPSDGGIAAAVAGDPVAVLRALARGSTNVCAGGVTIDPKFTRTPCGTTGQPGDAKTGALVTFTGCKLQGGGEIREGTIDVSSEHTASDANCDGNTVIGVSYTSTISNLTYVAPSGRQTVIRTLTDSGSYDHSIGMPPQSITSQFEGRIQRITQGGAFASDRTISGTENTTLSGSPLQTTTSATLSIRNAATDGGVASVSVDSLLGVIGCCHPVGGTVTTTGAETATVTFGPGCGDSNVNGKFAALGECP